MNEERGIRRGGGIRMGRRMRFTGRRIRRKRRGKRRKGRRKRKGDGGEDLSGLEFISIF